MCSCLNEGFPLSPGSLTLRSALLLAAKNRTHTHIFKAVSLMALGSFFSAAWAVAAARTSEGASPKLFGDDACWTAVLVQSCFLLGCPPAPAPGVFWDALR